MKLTVFLSYSSISYVHWVLKAFERILNSKLKYQELTLQLYFYQLTTDNNAELTRGHVEMPWNDEEGLKHLHHCQQHLYQVLESWIFNTTEALLVFHDCYSDCIFFNPEYLY